MSMSWGNRAIKIYSSSQKWKRDFWELKTPPSPLRRRKFLSERSLSFETEPNYDGNDCRHLKMMVCVKIRMCQMSFGYEQDVNVMEMTFAKLNLSHI